MKLDPSEIRAIIDRRAFHCFNEISEEIALKVNQSPEKSDILSMLDELREKYGNLSFGEPLIVNGKSYDVGFPVFLTDGDNIFILPFGRISGVETKMFSVPLNSVFETVNRRQ